MELEKRTFEKLCSFIHQAKEDQTMELEARVAGKNFKGMEVDYPCFSRVFKKLTYKKENNGLGLNFSTVNTLDILIKTPYSNQGGESDTTRLSIIGEDNVKKYWLFGNLNNISNENMVFIEKEKLDRIDDENYPIRFSLNKEKPSEEINRNDKNLILNEEKSKDVQKIFRMKNRYSILTDDELFSIDLTTTKMGFGTNFRESGTMKALPSYEIEIEFIGRGTKMSDNEIANKFILYSTIILSTLQNSDMILKQSLIKRIIEDYERTTRCKTFNGEPEFIAANPVTFHRHNLVKSETKINIYSNYAITLKADGERHFMYVLDSDDEEEDGKIFLIDGNFKVIDTGFQDKSWTKTLIEGELVQIGEAREFYMYDVLFEKGRDVRGDALINIKTLGKGEKGDDMRKNSRLISREFFFKSDTRKFANFYNEKNCITFKKKKYEFLIFEKGRDVKPVFAKIRSLWDQRNLEKFKSDGIIFTPINERYPEKGGSWQHLLKWKPPQLNTIDFLIKTIKTDGGQDIKLPYTQLRTTPEGKREEELKQYKTVRLFVGSFKSVGNRKKIPVAVEFNPNPNLYNVQTASIFNLTNVIINDADKMVAIDDLQGTEEFIEDDTVVEFAYNPDEEEGFRWKPMRNRKDKTLLYKAGKKIANNEKVAIDVFNAILYPVTEQNLFTGEVPVTDTESGTIEAAQPYFAGIDNNNENFRSKRLAYQDFHNHFIKFILYYITSPAIRDKTLAPKGKILDMCSGKGVDMNKIGKAKYYELVGIDVDYANVKKAQELFRQLPVKPQRAFFMRGDSGKLIFPEYACGTTDVDKTYMKQYIKSKYLFDTMSFMFCIHYLFKDEISLRSCLQNMSDNLKIGGFVIGTTFDGQRINEALKGKKVISGKKESGEVIWKIEKKYTKKLVFDEKKAILGQQIDVLVGSIGNPHPEYLVSFPFFDKMMRDYGFEKIWIKPFAEFYDDLETSDEVDGFEEYELERQKENLSKISPAEKQFSCFSNAFVYKKVQNAPDYLLQNLLLSMEKKMKIEDEAQSFEGQKSSVDYSITDNETQKSIIATEAESTSDNSLAETANTVVDKLANNVASEVLKKVATKINNSLEKSKINVVPRNTPPQNDMFENLMNKNKSISQQAGHTEKDNKRTVIIEYMNEDGEEEDQEELEEDSSSGEEYESDNMDEFDPNE